MKKVLDDVVASLGWRESTSGDHASEIETFLNTSLSSAASNLNIYVCTDVDTWRAFINLLAVSNQMNGILETRFRVSRNERWERRKEDSFIPIVTSSLSYVVAIALPLVLCPNSQ